MGETRINRIAKKPRRCVACCRTISIGEKYHAYRERALSSHEAIHAGAYPLRHLCSDCCAERGRTGRTFEPDENDESIGRSIGYARP